MECPVTVPNPEVGTPPIQDGVQLLDHHIDTSVRRKRPCHFTHALANIAAGLLTWQHTQHPTSRLTELEAEKRETFCQRRQRTLLLIRRQVKSGELTLELIPCLQRRARRLRQQHQVSSPGEQIIQRQWNRTLPIRGYGFRPDGRLHRAVAVSLSVGGIPLPPIGRVGKRILHRTVARIEPADLSEVASLTPPAGCRPLVPDLDLGSSKTYR